MMALHSSILIPMQCPRPNNPAPGYSKRLGIRQFSGIGRLPNIGPDLLNPSVAKRNILRKPTIYMYSYEALYLCTYPL